MQNGDVKIVHIMADGTIRDSIAGVIVPVTPQTLKAYKVFEQILTQVQQEKKCGE